MRNESILEGFLGNNAVGNDRVSIKLSVGLAIALTLIPPGGGVSGDAA